MALTARQTDGGVTYMCRLSLWPSWLAVAALAAGVALGSSVPTRHRYMLLAASVVVIGLPHGAVDHLALPRAAGERPTVRWFVRVSVCYLILGTVYAVVWFVAPVVAIIAFIVLTWFHWGQGDLYPLLDVVGVDHLRTRTQRALTVAVRGGLPMLVPLLAFPARYRSVVESLLGLFGVGVDTVAVAFRADVRVALGTGFIILTVLALSIGYVRADDQGGWLVDVGETGLLWWYFLTVPPVLAVGVYFPLWHSLRHVARLLDVDPNSADALHQGRVLPALVRFIREATPLTLLSLLVFWGLYVAVPRSPGDLRGLVAVYLVFIAVLTLPHVAIVSWMDREQGLWTPRGR